MEKVDISVDELVKKVQRGELTLPEMQRRYIWPDTRVRDLRKRCQEPFIVI